jgi:hypothetical protein
MGFLYYINGGNAAFGPREAAALGLGYALADPGVAVRQVVGGPDGGNGVIAAAAGVQEVGYFPDRQTWRRLCTEDSVAGTVWVGLAPLRRPGPADLARVDRLSGHWIELLDGHPWLVPIARGWSEEDGELRWYHNVPMVADLDDAGRWTRRKVSERYAAFWDLVCRWDEARGQAAAVAAGTLDSGSVTVSFEFDDLLDAAVQVLAQNYRLGRTEAALLGLLSDAAAVAVLNAAADMPTRRAWHEKKSAARAG